MPVRRRKPVCRGRTQKRNIPVQNTPVVHVDVAPVIEQPLPKIFLTPPINTVLRSSSRSPSTTRTALTPRVRASKMALCIGINYINTSYELKQCINDAKKMQVYLINNGYTVILMTDDALDSSLLPTKENILRTIDSLNADEVFIHYSGHGSYVRDRNRDEKDGRDECWIGISNNRLEWIVDDDICNILKSKSNTIIRLLCDNCHSGTCTDLKIAYNCTRNKISIDKKNKGYLRSSDTEPIIVSVASSLDNQVSYEYSLGGALTVTYLRIMSSNPFISTKDLITELSNMKYQKPMVTSNTEIFLGSSFINDPFKPL